MDLYLYSKIAELGDNETGRGGDYESALDCLICFIRQSHSSQDNEFNHIPLIPICKKMILPYESLFS